MHKDIFQDYNHLGFFCPYYIKTPSGEFYIDSNYSNFLGRSGLSVTIDPVAVIEVMNCSHLLGDRTIVKNIFRTPWMARSDSKSNLWNYYQIPKHQEKTQNETSIAEELFVLICKEIRGYVGNSKKIGILLSGGMDSRMVAGGLDYLIKTGQIESVKVTAYTWGNPGSRDVVYAEEIAKRMDWNWKHYTVTTDDLWENFRVAGHRGCEYSGINLHAIPQIHKDITDDVLLVGSYGDGIGRAEYQGIHVENLFPINYGFGNFGNLLKHRIYSKIKNSWNEDIIPYHTIYAESKQYQQNELDSQLHYMRRMINPCMEILNDVVPTHQVFTSPEVYNFMWSFKASNRNDRIYLHMLDLFCTVLNDIPWSRTGLPFGINKGRQDKYLKNNHSYSFMIQNQLIDKIETRIMSGRIKSLELFNSDAIEVLLKLIRRCPNKNFDYLQRITWLVSLDFFLEEFGNAKIEEEKKDPIDFFFAYLPTPIRYFLVQKYRWVRDKVTLSGT